MLALVSLDEHSAVPVLNLLVTLDVLESVVAAVVAAIVVVVVISDWDAALDDDSVDAMLAVQLVAVAAVGLDAAAVADQDAAVVAEPNVVAAFI